MGHHREHQAVAWLGLDDAQVQLVGALIAGALDAGLGEALGLVAGGRVQVEVPGAGLSPEATVLSPPDLLITETMAMPGRVSRVSGAEMVITEFVELSGAMPITMPIAIVTWGEAAYFTAHLGYTNRQGVHAIAGEPLALVTEVDAGGLVYWADVDGARERLLVADMERVAITPYALPTLEVADPIPLPAPPVSVRVWGETAWVTCQTEGSPTKGEGAVGEEPGGYVVRVDLSTDGITAADVGEIPYWAEPSPDGAHVAVADEGSGELLLLDAATLETLAAWPVGEAPTGVAWSPGGERIYVSLYTRGRLVELDAASGEVSRSWDLSGGESSPGAVGVFARDDGRRLMVPVLHRDRVAVIDTATDAAPTWIEGVSGPRAVAFWARE